MHSLRFSTLWAVLLAPAALLAQNVTTQGSISVGGGGTFLDGDRPALQQIQQHKKDGFGGIEEYRLVREAKDSVLKFNARIMPGDDNYLAALRFDQTDRWYVDAGFSQYRVWYDGSGGYFHPSDFSFVVFDEDLSLTRSKIWAEFGAFTPDKTLFRFRYERRMRNGTKGSTYWGDTNLLAGFSTRNIVPTFYDLDETTDILTVDVGNETKEDVKWNVGARYSETKLNDSRYSQRRPTESVDRTITTKDESKNDLFTMHGYYERKISESLTLSGGAMRTTLDEHIEGTRIYGTSYDPVFDPKFSRRQYHDEGYSHLTGSADIKQTVLNANAVYVPAKGWSVRPSLRFENLHQDTMSNPTITNVGNVPLLITALEHEEGESNKKWDELAETVEVRYAGTPEWTYSGKAEWIQGDGTLGEQLGDAGVLSIDRDTDYKRHTQKYSLGANWYVQPGLTFAAQYYFKGNMNDYKAVRDNTLPGTADRYPAYITNQDFETNDFNVRMTWRAALGVHFVSRYDIQKSKIISSEAGVPKEISSEMTSHIFAQNITWSPTGQLFLNANVNVGFDQVKTPALAFVQNGDNNYINGSVGGGYAVGKLDDLYVDCSWYKSNNYIDRSAQTLPYGASQSTRAAYLTWVRRQSENLIYTFKYGYVYNRDDGMGPINNFDAHVVYAKMQYKF